MSHVGARTRDESDFEDCGEHIEDHGRQDECYAARAPVDDPVQRAGLPRQMEPHVQRMQMRKHIRRHTPHRALRHLHDDGFS